MSATWARIEYGVIVDRRSIGHGFHLASTFGSLAFAEMAAEGMDPKFPVEIKRRRVVTSEWEPLDIATEHVGGCNDRCDGDSHYLHTALTPAPADASEGASEAVVSEGGGGK